MDDLRVKSDRFSNLVATSVSLIALVVLIWLVVLMATDAMVKTVAIQEQYYGKPVTYDRPAAFRLATPTPEQMDHLHHVQQIAQVRR